MATRQATFGRRLNPQASAPVAPAAPKAPAARQPPATGPADVESPSVDQEVAAWKRARGSKFQMPWSQLSLMASLCFGIASFVLPDSVNDNVDWLLWALTIMSALVWFSNRKTKKLTDSAGPERRR